MAYTVILNGIPSQITAGDSVSWKVSNTTYPATLWTLTYTLINSSGRIQITSTASGSDHLIEIPAATSAAYTAGSYDWQAHVSNGTERYQIAVGVIEILVDFATQSSGYDSRSHTKIVLDALEASIEGRASKTQMSQSVGGLSISHMTLEEQVKMRDLYAKKYQNELVAAGKAKSKNLVLSRFKND